MVLTTPRLHLRDWALSDAEDVARICNDKDLAAATASLPHPYTLDHARQWLQDRIDGKIVGFDRAVTLAACLRADGSLVAACGLRIHDHSQVGELGYWVAREVWGKGYATEAAAAVVDYGFDVLGLRRLVANYQSWNAASGRVLEKLGFVHEGRLRRHVVRFGQVSDLVQTGLLKAERASTPPV